MEKLNEFHLSECAAWTDLAADLNFGQLTYQGDHSGFFS